MFCLVLLHLSSRWSDCFNRSLCVSIYVCQFIKHTEKLPALCFCVFKNCMVFMHRHSCDGSYSHSHTNTQQIRIMIISSVWENINQTLYAHVNLFCKSLVSHARACFMCFGSTATMICLLFSTTLLGCCSFNPLDFHYWTQSVQFCSIPYSVFGVCPILLCIKPFQVIIMMWCWFIFYTHTM